ncbi:MAG: thioredoxin-dependent thiol peroxidase [Candidatus Krumholzibacteria bacterium]|nr:thioredoxin-dependent thiol peroxidase [Candidatus Krumholzibacteria bacterium]
MLEAGKKAPAFNLPDQDGNKHRLSDYAGKWVLVYFYPKDNTSGCTKEACAIRDDWSDFRKLGAVVLGVSKDSVKSHRNFADKHSLPFTLLSDESTKMIEKYGAWQKKKMAGREYMGIVRISYLIDPKGKVAKVYAKVKPPEHSAEVLADLRELM